eukprot:comp11767_c0_seq1/m.6368 comp11767_c0_seq1/g.6368  ORF comp11767_c0_seq1/g.6368 comp11767_c0_seq1/m.6368 type:complete len:112 (-) comp11767_c0_seq1:253-588(-)
MAGEERHSEPVVTDDSVEREYTPEKHNKLTVDMQLLQRKNEQLENELQVIQTEHGSEKWRLEEEIAALELLSRQQRKALVDEIQEQEAQVAALQEQIRLLEEQVPAHRVMG